MPVLTALAGALQRSGGSDAGEPGGHRRRADPPESGDIGAFLMQSLLPLLLGVWSGSMIGQLAHHALGQYDLPLPLHGPPTQRFLVRNVEAFGEEWSLPGRRAPVRARAARGRARRAAFGAVGARRARAARDRIRRRVRSATRRAPGTTRRPQPHRPVVDGVAHPARRPEHAARRDALRSPGADARVAATIRLRARGLHRHRRRDARRADDDLARAYRRSAASGTASTAARRRRSSTGSSASSSTAATTTSASRSAAAWSSGAGSNSSTGCGPARR